MGLAAKRFTIVDGHAHTFSSKNVADKIISSFNNTYDIGFRVPGTGTIEDILGSMAASGVDCTVMANFAPPKIVHENNLWTISEARKHGNLAALVSFHPDMEGNAGLLAEEYIKKGAKGVKLHPMAQGFDAGCKELVPVYETLSGTGFPVVFHCGRVSNARLNGFSDLDRLLPVIEHFQDVHFILTHMADGNMEDIRKIALNYGNVSFDTSIVITGYEPLLNVNVPSWPDDGEVAGIIREVGAERVLFGSDYPWGHPGRDVCRLIGLKLDDNEKEHILGKNAIRLFQLDI